MKRWIVILGCLLATLLLLGCSVEEIYLGLYIDGKTDELAEPIGSDETPIDFKIEPGQSVTEVAGNLKAMDLISDTELFRRYVQYKGLDAGIQAGTYSLNQTMTIPEIARTLQKAESPDQQVTVAEGKRLEEISVIVSEQTEIDAETFLQLAQTGWQNSELKQKHLFLTQIPVTATLEGFLFPNTYRLATDATAYDLIDKMLASFDAQLTPEVQQGFINHNLTIYEGITLASIVEREAVVAEERPMIASVYYNRYVDGWYLSADPTVQYALGYRPDEESWWKHQLYFVDLDVVSPYNTYRNIGLPPGPIASPGAGAIQAAANPAESDYYFFMVDCTLNNGSHAFAITEEEHYVNFNICNP